MATGHSFSWTFKIQVSRVSKIRGQALSAACWHGIRSSPTSSLPQVLTPHPLDDSVDEPLIHDSSRFSRRHTCGKPFSVGRSWMCSRASCARATPTDLIRQVITSHPEREPAERCGVTRTTLKHALERLIQAGLLETLHGIGTSVHGCGRLGAVDLLLMPVRHDAAWISKVLLKCAAASERVDRRTPPLEPPRRRSPNGTLLWKLCRPPGTPTLCNRPTPRCTERWPGQPETVSTSCCPYGLPCPPARTGHPAAAAHRYSGGMHRARSPLWKAIQASDADALHAASERIMPKEMR
ncbi:GntR family transcriptional regulator [Streptomyces sp. NPDC085614]|uniref:GntR family transcriptional regulator n=1 Tax=Streptomyces sp. NPDC085614 TaxID=3365733 RepID=UPI0037D61936